MKKGNLIILNRFLGRFKFFQKFLNKRLKRYWLEENGYNG